MGTTHGSRRVSRALCVLATCGALGLMAAFPGAAHAKKQHKLKMDPSVPETAEPAGPVPPEADANGHVNFANPQAEGLGRVTVKSKSGDKIQVYLEGRYFGDAPVTVYSVPKGDYIVEGTIVGSGKQVSSPVSVTENEEATVEIGGAKSEAPAAVGGKGGFMGGEISPSRLRLAKICLIVGGVALVGGVAFAVLENSAENDYEKAAPGDHATLDSISSRGRRDAALADLGFALAGVAVVGAVIAGYPLFTKPSAEKTEAPATAFMAPMLGHGVAGGALSLRF
ncbi:MAG TPA: hypothetical protein VGK52_08430 [Polyangia bacterium]